MKKKVLVSIFIMIMCFVLIGCGKDNNETVDDSNENKSGNVENTDSDSNAGEELKLYSDDTKYVFEYGNIHHVFYYSGDDIVAYHAYIDYEDDDTANYAYQYLKSEDLTDVDKSYVDGKYIVFEYNKSQYENLTASSLRTVYSYMEEITK